MLTTFSMLVHIYLQIYTLGHGKGPGCTFFICFTRQSLCTDFNVIHCQASIRYRWIFVISHVKQMGSVEYYTQGVTVFECTLLICYLLFTTKHLNVMFFKYIYFKSKFLYISVYVPLFLNRFHFFYKQLSQCIVIVLGGVLCRQVWARRSWRWRPAWSSSSSHASAPHRRRTSASSAALCSTSRSSYAPSRTSGTAWCVPRTLLNLTSRAIRQYVMSFTKCLCRNS